MLYRIFILLILLLTAPAWGATYCVRSDGTVDPSGNSWADMELANDCSSAATSMPLSGLAAAVSSNQFDDGDIILISNRGGQYNITNDPDNRVYLQGGSSTEITYRGEPGYIPTFDGGGTAGPLFYVTAGTQKRFNIDSIIVLNWANDNNAFYCSKATVTFNAIQSTSNVNGGTVIRTYSDTIATINNSTFGGYLENHWVGAHENSVVTINNCSGYGGKANAVHSIETSSVEINNTIVYSPVADGVTGTAAFALEGSGTNSINRCKVYINKNSYNGVYTGTSGTTTTINYSLFVFGGTAAGNSASGKIVNAGTLNFNNCTIVNTLPTTTVKGIFGTGAGGDQTFKNCLFFNCDAGGTTEIGYVEGAGATITCVKCVFYNSGTILAGDATFVNTNPINENPLLNNSYGLIGSSPAIDAGIAISGLHSGSSISGGDASGNTILYGSGIDIGAFEIWQGTAGQWFFEFFGAGSPTIYTISASGDSMLWDASNDVVLWDASNDKVLWD